MQSQYDSYSSGSQSNSSSSRSDDQIELKTTPYTTLEFQTDRVFGAQSQYGQSLGITATDVKLIDGALYIDPEKEKYKLFSWEDVTGLPINEQIEREMEPVASDAPNVETKTYVGNKKTYELVAARVPEFTDDSGTTVLEASSIQRNVSVPEPGDVDIGDTNDLGGDPVTVGDIIMWSSGSEEHGPTASSQRLARLLTEYGDDAVSNEDDLHGWLTDVSGNDISRPDISDRRVRYFTVTRESENGFTYHVPIIEDVETGESLGPYNSGDSKELEEARSADESDGSYPEPVADFISTGRNLNLTEDRAHGLIEELIDDTDNQLTQEMVADAGGQDDLVAQVI